MQCVTIAVNIFFPKLNSAGRGKNLCWYFTAVWGSVREISCPTGKGFTRQK